MIQSLHDDLTRPTSNTSTTLHSIFTLKSSNPVYKVQSTIFFLANNFWILMWKKVYDQRPFLTPILYSVWNQIFIGTESFGHCQQRLKCNWATHEMESISCQASTCEINPHSLRSCNKFYDRNPKMQSTCQKLYHT